MKRDNVIGAGCALVFVVTALMFLSALLGTYAPAARNRMFSLAFTTAAVGVVCILAVSVLMVWLDVRRDRAAERVLIERARKLREERARQRAHRPAPPPAPPAEAPRQVVTLDLTSEELESVQPPRVAVRAADIPVKRATKAVGTCPYCQTRIEPGEEYLNCPACKTPYHADCWEANGGCAVYGCAVRTA